MIGDIVVNSIEEEDAHRKKHDLPARVPPPENGAHPHNPTGDYVPIEYPKWVHGEVVNSPDEELALLEKMEEEDHKPEAETG